MSSEMTRFCIITDTSRKVKMAIMDWRVTPNVAIDDPLLMVGMPPALTAATGMDALTRAVEAYVSTIATPVTDACALKAIELVAGYLRAAVANGNDMAHQLGGFYDLPHGVCNAILLPHVSRFNLIAKMDRFADIAIAMGENIEGFSLRAAADMALESIQTLSADVGIPSGLTELGVKEVDLKTMAENAPNDACGLTNPRSPHPGRRDRYLQKRAVNRESAFLQPMPPSHARSPHLRLTGHPCRNLSLIIDGDCMSNHHGAESKSITLYALQTCNHCKAVKNLLRERQIRFQTVYVDMLVGDERNDTMRQIKRINPSLSQRSWRVKR